MTAKEKAIELYDKFIDNYSINGDRNAKECAIICVDEIINYANDYQSMCGEDGYWQEVKNELEKM